MMEEKKLSEKDKRFATYFKKTPEITNLKHYSAISKPGMARLFAVIHSIKL